MHVFVHLNVSLSSILSLASSLGHLILVPHSPKPHRAAVCCMNMLPSPLNAGLAVPLPAEAPYCPQALTIDTCQIS